MDAATDVDNRPQQTPESGATETSVDRRGASENTFENESDRPVHNPSDEIDSNQSSETSLRKKMIVAILLVAFVGFVIVDSLTNGYVASATSSFLDWVEAHPAAGFFAFVAAYFAATVLFVPGSLLTLGGGFIFANAFGLGAGVLTASFAVFVGASAGATVAFLLGRFLLRDWVTTLTTRYPIFKAIDTALQGKGLRIMVLLRLSPIIPFNALNYIAGVTAVSIRDFCWALVALLPGTVFYVFLGATAESLSDSGSSGSGGVATIVSIAAGLVFGILAIATTSYYAKKELNRVIREDEGNLNFSTTVEEGTPYGTFQ